MIGSQCAARWPLLTVLALGFAAAGAVGAQYWDQDEPRHGGVTNWNTNSEYSFELVVDGSAATVYIEDHEEPVSTEGAKGTLDVTRDRTTRSADLVPAGGNRMVARGVTIGRGDRVVARITLSNGIVMMVGRFIAP